MVGSRTIILLRIESMLLPNSELFLGRQKKLTFLRTFLRWISHEFDAASWSLNYFLTASKSRPKWHWKTYGTRSSEDSKQKEEVHNPWETCKESLKIESTRKISSKVCYDEFDAESWSLNSFLTASKSRPQSHIEEPMGRDTNEGSKTKKKKLTILERLVRSTWRSIPQEKKSKNLFKNIATVIDVEVTQQSILKA